MRSQEIPTTVGTVRYPAVLERKVRRPHTRVLNHYLKHRLPPLSIKVVANDTTRSGHYNAQRPAVQHDIITRFI